MLNSGGGAKGCLGNPAATGAGNAISHQRVLIGVVVGTGLVVKVGGGGEADVGAVVGVAVVGGGSHPWFLDVGVEEVPSTALGR